MASLGFEPRALERKMQMYPLSYGRFSLCSDIFCVRLKQIAPKVENKYNKVECDCKKLLIVCV